MTFWKRYIRGRLPCPAGLFLALTGVYCELILYFWTAQVPSWLNASVIGGLALGFGLVMGCLVSFLPPKAGKWTAVVLSVILAAVYLMEYFIHDAFQVFMPISVILAGGEGVAGTYLHTVLKLLGASWWRIALVLLPSLVYALAGKPIRCGWKLRTGLAAGAAAAYGVSILLISTTPGYGATLTSAYEFNNAVEAFGLHISLPLDLIRSSGAGQDADFELPEAVPTAAPTTAPTQAAAEPTAPEETLAPTEPPVVYTQQVLPIDFAALAQSETKEKVAAIHAYVAAQTPTMTNEYTGLFEGKNLIFITAEAFTAAVIDPELTPTLYRMATEGIQFHDYYQPVWGAGTTGGEFSNLVGLAPNGGSCMKSAVNQDLFLTIGNQLQKLGYSSAAYHNNDYTYYSRHETHEKLGYDYFMGYGNGIEEGVTRAWPQSDEEMFRFTIPMHLDQQPFSLYYMTVSGHSNYSFDSNDMAEKNWDKVEDLPYSHAVRAYLGANMELENSVAYLLEVLEQEGIAEDTVVVIAADHYPYGLNQSTTWESSQDYLAELFGRNASSPFVRDQNALIIWSGCLEDLDLEVSEPTFSLDILPTLSNLFGVEFDSRLLPGRDVFSDAEEIIFWWDYSWKTTLGQYDASEWEFTPAEGVVMTEEEEEAYVERVSTTVRNRIKYSKSVQVWDYFNYLTPYLQTPEETATEPGVG